MAKIDKDELKEHVLKCGSESKEAYKPRFKLLDEWQKRFDCLRSTGSLDNDVKPTPWIGAANVGMPLDATIVYTLVSRLIKAEFGVDPAINVRPYDLPASPVIQRMINWQCYTEMDLFIQKILWYQGCCVDGDKIIKTIIDKEEVWFDDESVVYLNSKDEPYISKETGAPVEAENDEQPSIYDPISMDEYKPKKATVSKNRIVYYGPRAIAIPAKCFFVPQNADSIDPSKIDWCLHEFWRPYGWLHSKSKQNPEMFDQKEVDELKKIKDKSRSREEDSKMKTLGIDLKTKTKMFKFHEWHGKWEDEDGNTHELVALAAPEQKRFLGYIPNRFFFKTGRRQFVHYTLFPQDGKFWSRGIPEIIRGIRSMLDTLFNTGLDRGALYNNPPLLYALKNSGFDPSEHKFGPGKSWGLLKVTDDMIRTLQFPTSGSTNELEYQQILYSVVQRLFGITDFSLGGAGQKGITGTISGATSKTASGISSLIQESNIRFDVFVRLVQQWSNPELAMQIFKHFTMNRHSIMDERQQLNKPSEIFDPIMELSEDDINHNFEFTFPGNTGTINPFIEQQNVQALAMYAQKAGPMVSDDPEVMNQIHQQFFNAYGSRIKIKSVDEYRKMMATEPQKAKKIRADAMKQDMGLHGGGGQQESELMGAAS
jgi:hypothetical protein